MNADIPDPQRAVAEIEARLESCTDRISARLQVMEDRLLAAFRESTARIEGSDQA